MNSLTKPRLPFRLLLSLSALLLLLAAARTQAQVILQAGFFTNSITLDGDISDFFFLSGPSAGLARPGVCVRNDGAGLIGNDPGSVGLGPNGTLTPDGSDSSANEPNSQFLQLDPTVKHPNGFNQRRIMTAYNPSLNGGTIFVGLDLPGGFTDQRSLVNPNFVDSFVVRGGVIKPFDADGNGEPETIGRRGACNSTTNLFRCDDAMPGDCLDIVDCNALIVPANGDPPFNPAGGFSDFARDGQEIYSVTIVFGPDPNDPFLTAPKVTVDYIEDFESFSHLVVLPNGTNGLARLRITQSNVATPVGAAVSMNVLGLGANGLPFGLPLGVDVEFMITNVNAAVPDACLRFQQNITANSGSDRDAGNGEDQTSVQCAYTNSAGCLKLAMTCPPPTNSPGSLFRFTGSVSNCDDVTLSNIIIRNEQAGSLTVVTNFSSLAPRQTASFTVAFLIPAAFKGCQIVDTLTVEGAPPCGSLVTDSLTQTCSLTTTLRIGCPTDLLVECLSDVPFPDPNTVVIKENSGGPAVVTFIGAVTNLIGCTNIITRTYLATNECSAVTCAQTIIVVDRTKPMLMGVPPANLSLQCPSDVPPQAIVTAMDNCDGPVPVTPGASTNVIGCTNFITRTWTASDKCKNTNMATQLIIVVDTMPPQFSGVPPNQNFVCLGDVPAPSLVSALDNCDGAVLVSPASTTNVIGCTNIITRTWTASDRCKNTNVATQIITVVDTIKPDLLGVPPVNLSAQCLTDVPAQAVVTAMDNCDGPVPVTPGASTNVIGCTNIITRTWTAVDRCKNTNSATQIITVIDTIKPDLIGLPPVNLSLQCPSEVPPQAVVTASDICDGPLPVTPTASTNVIGCTNIITRTWTAVDRCKNTNSATQIITVIDTIKPDLIGLPPVNLSLQCPSEVPPQAVVTASDICDGPLPVTPTASTNVIGCTNIITRTWTAVDRCKNTNSATQIITVIDTIKPDLLGLPPMNLSFQCPSDVPPQAVVTASDICDGPLPVTPTASTNVIGCTNIITRTWTASDRCKNTNTATQIITVVDTIPPQLSGVPPNQNFQCLSDVPAPALVSALDNCDGAVLVTPTSSTNVIGCTNIITRIWTAFDRCKNTNSATQTITVVDTIKPDLLGLPPVNLSLQCPSEVPPQAVVTAVDNCDGPIPVTPGASTNVIGCTNIITRTWLAVDRCKNTNSATQLITVVDTTAPQLVGVPPNQNFQCLNDVPFPAIVTALDNCDGFLTATLTSTTNGTTCPLIITNMWLAVDRCRNTNRATQIIRVQDTIRPVLVGVPPGAAVECLSDLPPISTVTATDNCDSFVPVTFSSVTNGTICPIFVTNTWTAVDVCRNTNTATQVISVRDTVPPQITCPSNLLVFVLGQVPPCPTTLAQFLSQGGTARDNCDTNLAYACANGPTNINGCITNFTRTHTVTDRCGNSASCPQLITIQSCPPTICVIKEVACVLPGGACGPFSDVATGFKSATQNPAFCYRITVTNCGSVALSNLRVVDDHLGDITGSFVFPGGQLPVGASVVNSSVIRRAWPTNTVNTVTATGNSVIDGTPVSASDTAIALVQPASLTCTVTATSPDDLDSNPADNHVQIPGDASPHSVTVTITICNNGSADLTGITISAPALATLGCAAPAPFSLAMGACSSFPCTASVTCANLPISIPITVSGIVDTSNGGCGYDINGNIISVSSTTPCSALIECQNCPTNCGSISACTPPYPFSSANPLTSIDFNESEVLRAFTLTMTNACVPTSVNVFYNDEHALSLGVRSVVIKTGGGTTTTDFPIAPLGSVPDSVIDPLVGSTNLTGDFSGTDEAGRPLFPSLFITDITSDPTSLAGDWQFGGVAIPPHAVFGTWKGAVRTVDKTKNPPQVTITPDADPAKNNYNLGPGADPVPPGLVNQGFGAEVRWDTAKLGLIPGHSYRLYFMVHDGDQNKTGGDVGQGCANVVMGGPIDCGAGAVGDFVWNDSNTNGVQDIGEPGIQGVGVQLLDCATMNVLRSTTTGPGGLYLFNSVPPGSYKVRFAPPAGFTFTRQDAGGNDAKDSDVDLSGLTACFSLGFNQTNLTIDAGVFQPAPGLGLIKSASTSIVLPDASVTYSYTVNNTSGLTLNNIVVTDDNGTPGFVQDDFTVGTVAVLPPNGSATLSRTVFLPVTLCDLGSSLPSGMIVKEVLPNGNFRVSFIQAFDVNDNTYGINSIGWGGPNGHKFNNLTGSDHVSWEFHNGAGQTVLAFDQDYISAASTALFPAGFGCLGFGGDGKSPTVGNAASVLDFSTSLEENLNKQPFLGALAQYTVNSPALNDPNSPFWEYRMIYTVVLDRNAFGASGLGAVAITDQHNSPGKRRVTNPQPCDACVTNLATATAQAGPLTMTANAFAKVCIDVPPRLAATVSAQSLTLTWEDPDSAYRLQCSGTCAPSGAWADMTNVPVTVNGRKSVQVPMSDQRQFYRLRKN